MKLPEETLYRSVKLDRKRVDEKRRTVALSFSSETPVQRYFGREILGHKSGEIDLSFFKAGSAPLLSNHADNVQIGVVESARLENGKGRAVVRFSKRPEAEAEFQDVLDGIRTNVSVGYRIESLQLESEDDSGPTYRATRWQPLEISLVSIPADHSVGVGRQHTPTTKRNIEMENQVEEIKEILAVGEAHNMHREAQEFVNNGKTAQQFKSYVLEKLAASGNTPVETDPEIGLTARERRQFSFLKALRYLSDPKKQSFRDDAGFEIACSQAVEQRTRRNAKGLFVPTDVLRAPINGQRDLNTQVDTAGGYMVANDLLAGSFINSLENAMVCKALGAVMLRDLVGDCAIPKKTGGATAYWLGEGDDITESQPTLGQIVLRPMGIGAYTDLTRKMMLQSSIDAENFVRNELAMRLGIGIDLAALSGTGAAGQPLGILNTTGIGSVTLNAANTPNWGDIVDLETAVAVDNALVGNLGYTANATIQGNMKQTDRGTDTGKFILGAEGPNTLNGHRFLMSNQVTAKYMIFGNWRDLIIGYWSGVDINVDTSSLSTSGGTRIVAMQDVDVAVRHPESFASGYKS